nr:immunoglobulin heavy chain junction region [Macaca mulatta]
CAGKGWGGYYSLDVW